MGRGTPETQEQWWRPRQHSAEGEDQDQDRRDLRMPKDFHGWSLAQKQPRTIQATESWGNEQLPQKTRAKDDTHFLVSQRVTWKGQGEEEGAEGKKKELQERECGRASNRSTAYPFSAHFFSWFPPPPSRRTAASAVLLPKWASTGLPADGREEFGDH